MIDKALSTYDRMMQDPKRRFKFEQEYRKFVLVEILIPLLQDCKISVRALADAAGISPTVIQDIKSGKKEGISFSTFLAILKAMGYKATIQIDRERKRPHSRISRIRRRKRTTL
jgi:DNA-binding Xre family transcriptional regulator